MMNEDMRVLRAVKRPRPMRLRDRGVLITGGSRGLGLVLARHASRRGARVAILGRERRVLDRARFELARAGADVYALACDVTDAPALRDALARVREQMGAIDVLVNNAGRICVGPADTIGREEMEASMRTHFWAAYEATSAVLPEMRARGEGRVVNVASIGGLVSVPHLIAYTASKHALVGWSKGLAAELAGTGVGVTTVCPGLMRTGSTRNVIISGRPSEYAWFKLGDATPLTSMSAERAARAILRAAEVADPFLVLSPQAKALALADRLFPHLVHRALSIVSALLPSAPLRATPRPAREVESPFTRSRIMELDRRAARRNNELDASSG